MGRTVSPPYQKPEAGGHGRPLPRSLGDRSGGAAPRAEGGRTISRRERRRSSLERAVLLDPRILILDDSASSVDTETEYLIQGTLQKLMRGRTTFVIAQRLRTVKMADEIIVLQDGRVVERGRHEELLANDGVYREIYDLELRDQEEALAAQPPSGPRRTAAGVAGR